MRSVKLITVIGNYDKDDEYVSHIGDHISDWDEVTDSEFKELRDNFYGIQSSLMRDGYLNYGESLLVISKDPEILPKALVKVTELIKEQQVKAKAEETKKLKAEATRIANAAKSKAEKERKLLAKLKAQYEPDKI